VAAEREDCAGLVENHSCAVSTNECMDHLAKGIRSLGDGSAIRGQGR